MYKNKKHLSLKGTVPHISAFPLTLIRAATDKCIAINVWKISSLPKFQLLMQNYINLHAVQNVEKRQF
jgi:hypothetical protein